MAAGRAFLFQHRHLLLKAFVILAAGTCVLFPTLHGWWYGDDDLYLGAPILREPDRLWKAWFRPGSFIEYYPITQTVQWYQWKLWDLRSTFGYHLTNLVLHLATALLLWRLLGKLGLKWAWIGGLIFAINPMMVDTIAAACELKNTLSLPPFLLAMAFYLDYENTRKPPYYALALVLFLVAMLCKITMFFFPGVILLYAWWKRDRITWPDLKAALPFLALSVFLGLLTLHAGEVFAESIQYHSPGPIHLGGFFHRFALVGLTLAFYLGHCFLPLHSLPYYPLWALEPLSPRLLIPWLGIALVIICCWRQRRRWGRPVLFALGFFVLGLTPFLGVIQTSYMCLTWVADHFVYIPIIGLIGLVVAGLEQLHRLLPPGFRLAAMAVPAAAFLFLGFQAHSYALLFADQEKLWTYTLTYNPNSWIARYELGQAFARERDVPKALEQFQESVRLNPDFYNAQVSLGLYLCAAGRLSEGADAFAGAVRDDPGMAMGHLYLAHALFQAGRVSESIEQLNQLLRLEPASLDARYGLSYALASQGRIPEAIAEIETALDYYPNDTKLQARLNELEKSPKQPANPPAQNPAQSK
jgi:cytochrome c-type biogenesis protein CcmH/NrfG